MKKSLVKVQEFVCVCVSLSVRPIKKDKMFTKVRFRSKNAVYAGKNIKANQLKMCSPNFGLFITFFKLGLLK